MTDNDILIYFSKWKLIPWSRIDINIKEYLQNRYSDSLSIQESYLRIKYHIEERPKCPICGKDVKFYGKETVKIFLDHCSTKCSSLDKKVQDKLKKTKLDKYGDENYNNSSKIKETCIRKYKVSNIFNLEESRKNNKISLNSQKTINKRNQTCLCKYGNPNVLSYYYSYNLIDTNKIKEKEFNTKRINHTFNTSKPEDNSYEILKNKFSNIIRQYKSKLYPYHSDFYIPELNLYIECNYHWSHGGHPYNPNNLEDQQKLNLWKSKNSKYYNIAINTWTKRDVSKREIVKNNKLNFIEFWNIKELNNWINKI